MIALGLPPCGTRTRHSGRGGVGGVGGCGGSDGVDAGGHGQGDVPDSYGIEGGF